MNSDSTFCRCVRGAQRGLHSFCLAERSQERQGVCAEAWSRSSATSPLTPDATRVIQSDHADPLTDKDARADNPTSPRCCTTHAQFKIGVVKGRQQLCAALRNAGCRRSA